MDAYALSRFIEKAGDVDARKRLQKAVFLIQQAGCDLGARYTLHYYGPYSWDVAETTNDLRAGGILHEDPQPHSWGERFAYTVTPTGVAQLRKYEETPEGQADLARIQPFFERFKELRGEDLWRLELAATMAYYHSERHYDWEVAKQKTGAFKKVTESNVLDEAEALALEYAGEAT